MERRQEVKALLKRWEAEFLRERQRRPGQADIEAAPEETKRLYQEYKMLKRQEGGSDPPQLTSSCKPAPPETPPAEQAPDSGCWGTHLNRRPKAPEPRRAHGDGVPKTSARYYGMKLKSNLGAAARKETPLTPRRTPTPRQTPVIAKLQLNSKPDDEVAALAELSEPGDLLLPPSVSGLTPIILTAGFKPPRPPVAKKFQQLKQTVARRLSSLDPSWLRRCQGDEGTMVGTEGGEEGSLTPPEQDGGFGGDSWRKRRRGDNEDDAAAPAKLPRCSSAKGEKEEEQVASQKENKKGLDPLENLLGVLEEEEKEEEEGVAPQKENGRGIENLQGRMEEDEECVVPQKENGKGMYPLENLQGKMEEEEEECIAPQKEKRKGMYPLENLLGEPEEEEEEKPRRPRRAGTARATPTRRGNFVRLNLKKKSHIRGYALRGSRLRKQVWKQKWQKKAEHFGGGSRDRSSDVCFSCGRPGHWAAACRAAAGSLPEERGSAEKEEEEEEEAPLPTLEEVARRTNSTCLELAGRAGNHEIPQEISETPPYLDVVRPPYEPPAPPAPVEPLYNLGPEGKVQEPPEEVIEALKTLGYSSFRPGQAVAIMRILSGRSTLVVLSTGSGKSLCYQLPAYLYHKRSKCITLVVSPLVSLMDDQVSGLPPCLKAVCVHSNMSKTQREAAMEKVRQGEAQVLLLSPEALVGGGACLPSADRLPPVAFACIDEAHCLSEWSHNFRPCYLRLCKVLRDRLGVRCFLGLTATATLATARDVAQHLGIPPEEGVTVRSAAVPPNLHLSVSTERDRDEALISLLRGERFGRLDSVIVYCTRREETARVAALIRTRLQGTALTQTKTPQGKKSGRRAPQWIADAYHAGLSAAERRRVQNAFMSGRLRVVVATVAFGMGLDKPDVRAVVHYNMPKNFEAYVQEIGRAGRDGEPAHCHLFLDPEGGDLAELRRHIYGDGVDYFTVKKLARKVFSPCKCLELHRKHRDVVQDGEVEDTEMAQLLEEEEEEGGAVRQSGRRVCYKHERAIPIQQTVEELDVREEGIETLLCYLELHPRRWLELLPPTYSSCQLRCYGGPRQLRAVARSSPPVAVFLARERVAGRERGDASSVEFDVVSLSDSMGWEVPLVKRSLRQLQWDPRLRAGEGKSGILVEFGELSFHLRAYGDLADNELDSVCDFLHQKVVAREKTALRQLRACFRAFQSVAFQTCGPHPEEEEEERSAWLKALLGDYFEKAEHGCEEEEEEEDPADAEESRICADIRNFLAIRRDEKFTGRAVARIFHGIGSPCFPAEIYGRDRRFWRKHLAFDFHRLARLATEEILACR